MSLPVVASELSCSTPLLLVEQDGRVAAGSKETLRSAVQAGLPLRVGWSIDFDKDGKPDLAHWADAAFITDFEGEVFAQIPEIRRQMPKRGEGHVELSPAPQRWTGSLGSNGFLEGAFDDDQKPSRLRVRVVWCIDPRVPRENLPASIQGASAPPVAILGGAIIDPDADGQPQRANIVIRGDRIVAVGPDVVPPHGARILDAGGKFLLPGLWDMHAHLNALTEIGQAPERYVGHGVLAVRDCGGYLDPLLALRRDIAAGMRTGPQLLIAGPTLNGERFAPFQRVVRNEAEARAAVRELAAAGVDFIKTHRATSREAFFAMLDEARRHGLHVAGHVPLAVSWIEATEAGMRSMEHTQTLPENEMSDAQAPATIEEAFARIDGERGDAIFAALARTGAAFDPTLIAYEESIDDRPEIAARRREAYGHLKSYVGRAHRAGVTILAGTDVLERHGEMLLVELERLVEAGLSPRQALAAATTHPARLMNRPDLGRIAPGATASLLIVEADPTTDVRHLRRLTAVLLRGRLIEKEELAQLRAAN